LKERRNSGPYESVEHVLEEISIKKEKVVSFERVQVGEASS